MLDVFRGWKRKLGVVLLLLALASLGAWVRGRKYGNDTMSWPIDATTEYVIGIPPAGYWFTKQRTKIFTFKNGGGTTALEYEWIFVIPYWYVSTPLTVASAWLLLSKPPRGISRTAEEAKE